MINTCTFYFTETNIKDLIIDALKEVLGITATREEITVGKNGEFHYTGDIDKNDMFGLQLYLREISVTCDEE
jgi:hypothetical protein